MVPDTIRGQMSVWGGQLDVIQKESGIIKAPAPLTVYS